MDELIDSFSLQEDDPTGEIVITYSFGESFPEEDEIYGEEEFGNDIETLSSYNFPIITAKKK